MSDIIPASKWLKVYSRDDLHGDLSAGITVGVLLVAQGMAYAMVAGMPPIYGLYASTIPLMIYAIFGSSRQLAVGPTALMALLTIAGVSTLAEPGSSAYIELVLMLALMVGILQFGLGLFRLGFLVNFLSHPVISGFTSAAAIIIGVGQLKHLLGMAMVRTHDIIQILSHVSQHLSTIHVETVLIGLGAISLIITFKKINRMIPGQLIVVLLGVVVVWLFELQETGVGIVGEIPRGLPSMSWVDFDLDQARALLPAAVAIALIGFMESYAIGKAIQAKHRNYTIYPNQELLALGLANLIGSVFQSFPVTGGFSRTAVNNQAGAKTGMASMISAALVILTLLFLTRLFYYLPLAVLAAIIIVAISGLIDLKEARHLWRTNRNDFWMLMVTFATTLAFGIEEGIAVGVLISLVMVIYRSTKPHIAHLGKVPGTRTYRNIDRFTNLEERTDILMLRFDAQLYFANIHVFKDAIDMMMERKGAGLRYIILDAQSINHVDSSAMQVLAELISDLKARGIDLFFADVKGPVRDAMARNGIRDQLGSDQFFMDVQSAVDFIDHGRSHTLDPESRYTSQANN